MKTLAAIAVVALSAAAFSAVGKAYEPKTRLPVEKDGVTVKRQGYGNRWYQKLDEIKKSGGEFDLVLVGDSITHRWESAGKSQLNELRKVYKVLDIGYGSDRTENVLWRFEHGELDGYKAKCFMVMIGTNNCFHFEPEEIAKGVKAILDKIGGKHPESKTILVSILPRRSPSQADALARGMKVNELISKYHDGEKVFYLDIKDRFLELQGEDYKKLLPDGTHPNAAGYRIWLAAAKPLLNKICGK